MSTKINHTSHHDKRPRTGAWRALALAAALACTAGAASSARGETPWNMAPSFPGYPVEPAPVTPPRVPYPVVPDNRPHPTPWDWQYPPYRPRPYDIRPDYSPGIRMPGFQVPPPNVHPVDPLRDSISIYSGPDSGVRLADPHNR